MNVVAKKSLGQNFLIDEKILNLIVGLGNINSNDIVLEVGPGTGNLTEKILKKGPKKIIVVEKDTLQTMDDAGQLQGEVSFDHPEKLERMSSLIGSSVDLKILE